MLQIAAGFSKTKEITRYLEAHKQLDGVQNPENGEVYSADEQHATHNFLISKHEEATAHFFPPPWETFREDVNSALADICVSRMPTRGITGEAHEGTIYSPKAEEKSGKLVNDGKAFLKNGSMVRLDVFKKQNKKGKWEFYAVPVYAHHLSGKAELPIRYYPAKGKDEAGFIDDSFTFLCSFYPNDLVQTQKEKGCLFGYFKGYDVSGGTLKIQSPNILRKDLDRIGIKTLDNIEKYVIDVLGTYHKVKKEIRQDFSHWKRGKRKHKKKH
jgi:CRISPR/Cas system Type II protein with McrA/HNH and RuvC-like nuclease domain